MRFIIFDYTNVIRLQSETTVMLKTPISAIVKRVPFIRLKWWLRTDSYFRNVYNEILNEKVNSIVHRHKQQVYWYYECNYTICRKRNEVIKITKTCSDSKLDSVKWLFAHMQRVYIGFVKEKCELNSGEFMLHFNIWGCESRLNETFWSFFNFRCIY